VGFLAHPVVTDDALLLDFGLVAKTMMLLRWSTAAGLHFVSKILLYGAETEHNIDRDGWGWKVT